MLTQFVVLVASVVAVAVTVGIAFVIGMRRKSPIVQRPVVWFTKRWINPRQLRTAGTAGAVTGVVRHRGRVSGRIHETPVDIVPAGDAFLIALPYGTNAQWVRNVLASGSATLRTDGRIVDVDRAELVPMAVVLDAFPEGDRRSFRFMKVDQCLRLRPVDATGTRPLEMAATA